MAVPNTTTFSLQDVVNEIPNGQTSLSECIAEASKGAYNNTYYSTPATNLLEFRDYDESRVSSGLTTIQLGVNFTSDGACSNAQAATYTTRYINNASFLGATELWTDSAGTNPSGSGYYSDGNDWRYWSGSAFTTNGLCTGGTT